MFLRHIMWSMRLVRKQTDGLCLSYPEPPCDYSSGKYNLLGCHIRPYSYLDLQSHFPEVYCLLLKCRYFSEASFCHQHKVQTQHGIVFTALYHQFNFPSGSVVKNLSANAGGTRSISGLRRSPGGGNGNPLQYCCLWNPKEEEPGGLLWGLKESDTT